MVSSISTLSIFILVLISGYFTLPIDNDFTPETSFNTRTIFGDDIDTTQINEIKRSIDEHIGFDVFATTVESQPTEHKERIFEDSFTTEEPSKKRTVEDLSMVTVEPSEHKERMIEESFTFEPTTEDSMKKRMFEEVFTAEKTPAKRTVEDLSMVTVEPSEHKERMFEESFTTEEPSKKRTVEDLSMVTVEPSEHKERMFEESFTTEEPSKKRTVEDLSMVTVEPSEHKERIFEESFTTEPTIELHQNKREFELKDTTATFSTEADKVSMPLFTSTSSAVAPELYVHGSTDFSPLQMTTQKYVGSLVDDEEHETEDSHNSGRKHQSEEEEVEKPKHTKSKSKTEDDEEVEGHHHDEEEKPIPKYTKSKSKNHDDKEVEEEKINHKEHDEELNNDKPDVQHKGEEENESRVEGKLSKKPSSSSLDKESTEDKKYVKAKLSDQVLTKSFPQTLNSRIAIYDSNDDVPSKTDKQTKTKLTQGKESSQTE